MQTDPTFRELWPERIKFFSNWGPPRQVRFGVNVTLVSKINLKILLKTI